MAKTGTLGAVWAALAGNLGVAVAKFAAAAVTGSSAMLSEAMHSLVDTVNEALLLYGMRQSAKPADREHPFGHGREIYFWSFVVALLIFSIGAGAAVYEGIEHLQNPHPIERPPIIYAVLGVSTLFEGISWIIGLRAFRAGNRHTSWWTAFRRSKDPPAFIVVFEDSAALLGIAAAAAGTTASILTRDPRWDGIASLVIAAILAGTAALLARESKALLIGERADPAMSRDIMRIASGIAGISSANSILTVQLAPNTIIATLSVDFLDSLHAPEIERIVVELEKSVRAAHPEVLALFVKPQSVQAARTAAPEGTFRATPDTLTENPPPDADDGG